MSIREQHHCEQCGKENGFQGICYRCRMKNEREAYQAMTEEEVERMVEANIKGQDLVFKTSRTVFSPDGMDKGTLAMLKHVEFVAGDRVLDLGCGYGVVGILAAKLIGPDDVVMTDIDDEAIALAKENSILNDVSGIAIKQSDGFKNISEHNFSLILSNPPYHVDFKVPKHFIEKGFNRLKMGGRMYLVTKRKEWYKNKMISIFGGVKIWEENGYFVFMSVKNSVNYSNKK